MMIIHGDKDRYQILGDILNDIDIYYSIRVYFRFQIFSFYSLSFSNPFYQLSHYYVYIIYYSFVIYIYFMKIINLFRKTNLILVFSLILISIYAQQVSYPPRLPLYIGKGYNILLGNPISATGVDPGFSHEIFQFTYDKHATTEDGKYQIPDQVSHRKTTACSFSTQISQYRGTESYQNELKTKAQIGGGYKGALFKASFSASVSYQKMHNETISENKTITQASAECQSYEMSIDLFKPGPISDNFWLGVNTSYHANNWDKFIEQFGTHFVYEVVLGGRATQQIIYDLKSISEMESIGIDINFAAKAKFASYYHDSSFNWESYKDQIKYVETLSVSIHQIYVGGHAPTTGHIDEWHQTVISAPMPITYKVLPISDLFEFTKDKTINVDLAKTKFLEALDHYCAQNKCKQPEPDKPKPIPAKITVLSTQTFGGTGGTQFLWQKVHPALNLHKVLIRSGQQIDKIQIQISDGVEFFVSEQFGGGGGSDQQTWLVPAGEYVNQIQFRAGYRVDSLAFVTNKNTRSPKYGGTGGTYSLLTIPEGFRIIGLVGRSGQRLDKLGFRIAKTQYVHGTNETRTIVKNLVIEDE